VCSAIGPLQLGGDGSDAPKQVDALIENGSFQIRGQRICAVLRKLILYGAEGGGGNDSAPLKAWDAGNF
jgi:hypothetical protein